MIADPFHPPPLDGEAQNPPAGAEQPQQPAQGRKDDTTELGGSQHDQPAGETDCLGAGERQRAAISFERRP